jgi:hypothetical protein
MPHTIEQAIQYWHRRMEREPEPIKSVCRENMEQLLMIQDGGNAPKEKANES